MTGSERMNGEAVPLRRRGSRRRRPHFHYFDRYAGSVFCPRFNAAALEAYFLKCAFVPACRRVRFGLLFVGAFSVLWAGLAQLPGVAGSRPYLYAGLAVLLVCGLTFALTFFAIFRQNYRLVGGAWAAFLVAMILGFFLLSPGVLSYVVMAAACAQILLIIYALVPVPLAACLLLGLGLSLAFELLLHFVYQFSGLLAVRVVLQAIVHLVGVFIHVSAQAVQRSTFMRQCESVLTMRLFRVERAATMDSIRSLMPPQLAQELIEKVDAEQDSDSCESDYDSDEDSENKASDEHPVRHPHGLHVFSEFHGSPMDNVTVLYADIIGIWKARKSAHETVLLLNDIYTCLDRLCEATGCEKITTLGDCYHCVAGCPDPVDDHAERCVEFGRAMCKAIHDFKEEGQGLDMRVGVHSGTVVYGIMGMHRFRFDVWSNDVNLARHLKTSSQDGRVHVSEDTLAFLKGVYTVEDAQPLCDIRKMKVLVEYFDLEVRRFRVKATQEHAELKTFFIVDRVDGKEPVSMQDVPQDDNDNSTHHRLSAEQENRDLVRLVEDLRHERRSNVFVFPPISPLSLNFRDRTLERHYRGSCRPTSLPSAVVLLLLLLLMTGAAASLAGAVLPFVAVAVVAALVAAAAVVLVWRRRSPSCRVRNVAGGLLLLLPAGVLLSRWDCCLLQHDADFSLGFASLLLAPLLAFSLFPSLSFWAKLVASLLLLLCTTPLFFLPRLGSCAATWCANMTCNSTYSAAVMTRAWPTADVQTALSLVLTFLLVAFFAREMDVSWRQAFTCAVTARREQRAVHRAKRQAKWLLRNIIPDHMVPDLRDNPEHCFKQMELSGVIFADICNFAYFYDEQYNGGQAMLGVLNAVFSDIEELLGQRRFKDVEKIKTVGSCFMAASGLDGRRREGANASWGHVHALLEFCLAMRAAVLEFNKSMFSFDFELKIGLSVGPLTAGVFGSRRLLYDILGDTVNQAYCLCNSGPTPGIRVPRFVAEKMADAFVFETVDEVPLKGAPDIPTCLLLRRR